MFTLRKLTIASIRMFVRNRQALFFTFFMPFIIMGVFGLVGVDKPPVISLGLAVSEPNEQTQKLIEAIGQNPSFEVSIGTRESELDILEKGERALVAIVPDELLGTSGQKQMKLYLNQNQPQLSQTGLAILQQYLNEINFQIAGVEKAIMLQVEEVDANNLSYIDFLIPGVVGIAIMQLGVFSVAFYFVDLKQKGVLKRLLATPMKPYQFVTANVITRLMVAFGQTIILIGVGILAFDFAVNGSYALLALVVLLGGVMFLSLGFMISGVSKTTESVPAIANLVVFPMLFLGNTFFPVSTMPEWLQHIVRFMPLTYFTNSLRAITNDGASFSQVSTDIYWMAGWSAVLLTLAILSFRFEERREE